MSGKNALFWILCILMFLNYSRFGYMPDSWIGFVDTAYYGGYYGYPMIGTILYIKLGMLLGSIGIFVVTVGLLAYVATVWLFFKTFEFEKTFFGAICMIPVAAIMSVKSTHQLTPFLFMLAFYLFQRGNTILSALAASTVYWFRSELLLLPVMFGIITKFRYKSFILIPLTCVAIWYATTGTLGTSNNMAVFYIGLFSLEGNPWKLEAKDEVAFKTAESWGAPYAWKPEAQSMFFWRSMAAIRDHPFYFVEATFLKAVRGMLRIWTLSGSFGGWVVKIFFWCFTILLWIPLFTKKYLSMEGVFLVTFIVSPLIIAAFSGNTTILNATYLFMVGMSHDFYTEEVLVVTSTEEFAVET